MEGVARLAGAAQPPAADDATGTTGTTGTTTEATPDPAVAPIPGFAELSAQAAVASLRTLDRAAALAALAFEQAHGNRPAVVRAARIRAGAVRDE